MRNNVPNRETQMTAWKQRIINKHKTQCWYFSLTVSPRQPWGRVLRYQSTSTKSGDLLESYTGLHVWGSNAEVMKTIFFVFFKVSEPGDIPQLVQFSFQLILNLFLHHNFPVDPTWGPVYVLEAKELDQMISHQGVSSRRSEGRFPEMRMRSCRFSAFGASAASRRASSITWCIGFEGSCVMFPGMVI